MIISKRNILGSIVILITILLGVIFSSAKAQAREPQVVIINAEGPLTPAMVEYLRRGLKIAEREAAEALIVQLNTPGGSIDLMNKMVQDIRSSDIPVVIYVSPRGAIAGSAGTVITMAGHIAAMAPETSIGAASPVGGQGEDLGETIEAKTKEALKATMRSLMEGRRPEKAVKVAEETIDDAIAKTSLEALEIGMIDLVAENLSDLLERIDGMMINTNRGEIKLSTANAQIQELPPSFIEELLATLTNPNVVFILLAVGVQAILIELGSPGGWVAGFVGAVCVTLASYGLGVLGVNWLGLIFIIIAFALFVLDIKAPTHGALTAAGVGSFIVGALVLFNSPGTPQFQRVSTPLVVFTSLILGGTFIGILLFAVRAQRTPIRTGKESLAGKTGIVHVPLDPIGIVQLSGEQWSAELDDGKGPVPKGTRVQVVRVEGIRLIVRVLPIM